MTAVRYDTLVLKNSTSKTVPKTCDGAEVVSWAAGHSIAEANALEEFVQSIADGQFYDCSPDELESAAQEALNKASQRRDNGYKEG